MAIQTQALPLPSEDPYSVSLEKEPAALQGYLKDASHFQGKADQIVFPTNEKQIAQLLLRANEAKIPVTVSGAGTGLTGARVPSSGIILSTERMNKILETHWDEKAQEGYVIVQPGVSLKQLEEALEKKGLFYPPNPGEKAAFIGGTVATNASGARSFKYGPTRRYVRRLRIILSNGDLLECRRDRERETGGIFEFTLSDGKKVEFALPSYSLPQVKSSAGYYTKAGMDLLDLFIGSEGTLGIFSEVELRILKKPEGIFGGILFFPSEKECAQFGSEVRRIGRKKMRDLRLDPRVLEFFDSQSLALLLQRHPEIPERAGAALFFEQELDPENEPVICQAWKEEAKKFHAFIEDSWLSTHPKDQQTFRQFRYDLPALVNEQVALNKSRKIGTDLAVPDEKAELMLDFYLEKLKNSGIPYCLFGHLGDNHLHVNFLPKTAVEFDRGKILYSTLAKKALELGGTISAEHGVGKLRIPYLEMMFGRQGLKEMARIKNALDPHGILNPGNIIPAELLHENWRR